MTDCEETGNSQTLPLGPVGVSSSQALDDVLLAEGDNIENAVTTKQETGKAEHSGVLENARSPTPRSETDPLSYQSQVPNRYRKRNTTDPSQINDRETSREEQRVKARETRKTRRTIRQQQQQQLQQSQELVEKREEYGGDIHAKYKLEVSTDSDASSVDENYDVASLAESIEEGLTWRGRMQEVLHNHWLHLVIVIFVALDAFIVIFELLLDIGAFRNRLCEGEGLVAQAQFCHYQMPVVCAPHAKMVLDGVNISAHPSSRAEDLCRCGYKDGLYICLQAIEASGVNPAFVLHIASLIILSLFMVEILVKIIAFRLKYFTHKFEVFDGVIVMISWTLDVASVVEEEAFEAAALLIVLRLWRVLRIVNGAVLTSKSRSDNQLIKAKNEAKKVIHAFHKAQDKMDEFEDENIQLRRELAKLKATSTTKPYKRLRTNSDESDTDTEKTGL